MAEIERKQRSILPWILGIVLLALVVWGAAQAAHHGPAAAARSKATAADTSWENIPPRLRQYA